MDNNRVIAGTIDHAIACSLGGLLGLHFIMLPLINNSLELKSVYLLFIKTGLIPMSYYLLRDIPSSGSIEKRVMKLQIINRKTQRKQV